MTTIHDIPPELAPHWFRNTAEFWLARHGTPEPVNEQERLQRFKRDAVDQLRGRFKAAMADYNWVPEWQKRMERLSKPPKYVASSAREPVGIRRTISGDTIRYTTEDRRQA
jgi:hypothetical protein